MVLVEVVGGRGGKVGARGGDVQDLLGARIHIGCLQRPGFDGGNNSTSILQSGGGHLEASTCADGGDGIRASSPVGDDHAVKTPFGAQNVGQQMLVFVGVGSVDEVVGAHDCSRLGAAAHDFETGQIDLAQRTLVHNGIRRHASQLLGVSGEVLGAGGGSRGLDALGEACRHAPCEDRVLGQVLKVASAQGRTLDVQAGAKQDVDSESSRFRPQRLTHLAGQVGVPRGRERGGRREAGGFFGVGDAEVVGVAELAAYAVGAVAHDEGGDVCCGDGA